MESERETVQQLAIVNGERRPHGVMGIFWNIVTGGPKNLLDPELFRHVALRVGLGYCAFGPDPVSSSIYGPMEALKKLHEHNMLWLAPVISLASIVLIALVTACYRKIVRKFPEGGGGYRVASRLLHPWIGMVSGCALLVDYILTVTVSIAVAGDMMVGLTCDIFPSLGKAEDLLWLKLSLDTLIIVFLMTLNLRGVKESVKMLMVIFVMFITTSALLLILTVAFNASATGAALAETARQVADHSSDWSSFRMMLSVFLLAFASGAGTFTGLEATSNGAALLDEPKAKIAGRIMLLIAVTLACLAGGASLCFYVMQVPGSDTMNLTLMNMLTEQLGMPWLVAMAFKIPTMIAAALILVVAAQAGYIDGPRVMANMAQDGWLPHSFGNLSSRLVAQNGVTVVTVLSLLALFMEGGNVTSLVNMYSINVFLTFSLSMLGMLLDAGSRLRKPEEGAARGTVLGDLVLFLLGFAACATTLVIVVVEKFDHGGWKTVVVTVAVIAVCAYCKAHYQRVSAGIRALGAGRRLQQSDRNGMTNHADPDTEGATAVICIQKCDAISLHILESVLSHPGFSFQNVIAVGSGVVGTGNFVGHDAVEKLKHSLLVELEAFARHTQRLGMASAVGMNVGTDTVGALVDLCEQIHFLFPNSVFFFGELILSEQERLTERVFHNRTGQLVQRLLKAKQIRCVGVPLVLDA